jgi:hypothetical protein
MNIYIAYDLDSKRIVAEGTMEELEAYSNDYGICSQDNYWNAVQYNDWE